MFNLIWVPKEEIKELHLDSKGPNWQYWNFQCILDVVLKLCIICFDLLLLKFSNCAVAIQSMLKSMKHTQ